MGLGPALLLFALIVGLAAGCSDRSSVNGPIRAWSGTFVGEFQGFGSIYPNATLELGQNGTELTGTLQVGGRTANLEATVDEFDQLEGTFTFTGECPGTASTQAEFHQDERILGSIEGTDDCGDPLNGTFNLERQS